MTYEPPDDDDYVDDDRYWHGYIHGLSGGCAHLIWPHLGG